MTKAAFPVISPVLRYDDAPAALEWLTGALGFTTRSDYRLPDGRVAHADLAFGPSVMGVSSASVSAPDSAWAHVRHGLYVQVEDPDEYHGRAVSAGAEIVVPLNDTDYGSREFSLRDPDGHLWGFGTYDMGAAAESPTIFPELRYRDVVAAIQWLERAIGLAVGFRVPGKDGALMHAELTLGTNVVMVSPMSWEGEWAELKQFANLRVPDPDAHFAVARAAGATIVREPETAPYGARFYAVRDHEGFLWWVSNYQPLALKPQGNAETAGRR